MNSTLGALPQRIKTPSSTFAQMADAMAPVEARETWKHISVALVPVVARLHRKRLSHASGVQP